MVVVSDTGWPQTVLVYLEVARVGSGTAPDAEKVFNRGCLAHRSLLLLQKSKPNANPRSDCSRIRTLLFKFLTYRQKKSDSG